MPAASTALLTDHYELTMVETARRSGVASHRATFEVFARRLPPGRRYGVVAGIGRILDALPRFRFGDAELAHLRSVRAVDDATLEWLAGYRFGGTIHGYQEGELWFPGSPVLSVDGTFAECVVLETLLLSILNHDSAVAAAASRIVTAAVGRPLIEMGSRRVHEEAAVAAARAAFIGGFDATSNLEAGRRWGVPTTGTSAHASTLAHADEPAAFAAQLDSLGIDTTLLVDTYDIEEGIRTAVRLANERGAAGPGAVRIDSGDLVAETIRARGLLDALGATATRIVVTSDLDEERIAALAAAPVDVYGVGTAVVTGGGHPSAGLVYKLVAIADGPGPDAPMRAVAKRSAAKATVGGRKTAFRLLDPSGRATAERIVTLSDDPDQPAPPDGTPSRCLHVPLVRDGEVVHHASLDDARRHHAEVKAELGAEATDLRTGEPAIAVTTDPTSLSGDR